MKNIERKSRQLKLETKDEVTEMSNSNSKLSNQVENNQELSREEKKKLRRAHIEDRGALHLDPQFKREGFRQRLVNVTSGNIEKYRAMGYNIIEAANSEAGNGSIDTSHAPGASLEVEVGRRVSQKAVWMEISEEDYQLNREIEADKAKELDESIGASVNDSIPNENRIGQITREE